MGENTDLKVSSFTICNLDGNEICKTFGSIDNFDFTEFDETTIKEPKIIKSSNSVSFTCKNFDINYSMLNSLASPIYDVVFAEYKQIRKHRKKRTNKKWLKRYGYKLCRFKIPGIKLRKNIDGTLEIVEVKNE